MTTSEIKSFIHETVESIDDEQFLEALKIMIETEYSDTPVLKEWQKKRIEESKKQIERGEFHTEEEADKIVEKWFKGK